MTISEFVIDKETLAKEIIKTKKASKTEITYEVELCSGCDMIIVRRTERTEGKLVILISQNLVYEINKDKKTETTLNSFMRFLNNLPGEGLETPECSWIKKIEKGNLEQIYKFITNGDLTNAIKKNLFTFDMFKNPYFDYTKGNTKLLFDTSPNFMKWIKDNIPTEKITSGIIRLACKIYNESPDNAKYFLLKAAKTSLRTGMFDHLRFCELYDPSRRVCDFDFKTLTDYIFFGFYKQGFDNLYAINTYADYLNLSIRVYGRIKEKYPKDLFVQHEILSRISRSCNYSYYEDNFNKNVETYKDFEFVGKQFFIKTPKSYFDLIEEGTKLGHCVAEYIEKVANGECMIFLMRKIDEPDEPYLTVEMRNYAIYEVEGDNKRFTLTEDEIKFFRQWAKAKMISLDPNENFHDKFAA